jgi:predicted MFS family arabinose efflux permease
MSRTEQSKTRFSEAVNHWFLRGLSNLGLTGLPTQIYVLLILNFIFSIGRNIAFPYLAMFLTAATGKGGLNFDATLVGTMMMTGGLASTFSYIVTGNLCDKFGRKRLMFTSITLQAFSVLGFAFVRNYTEFLLLYTATSTLGSFYDPAQSAMIADLVQTDRREEVYGLTYMIGNIGTIAGPPIGGIIAATSGYQPLFIYAATAAAIVAAVTILRIKESYCPTQHRFALSQFTEIFRNRIFMLYCISAALTSFVYNQLYGLLSVYIQYVGFEPYIFGILFSVNGAMVVALHIPIRKAAMRIGPTKAFIIAQALYAAGFAYFMFAADFTAFLTGVVVLTLGEITYVPASTGFVANQAPPDKRGRYMATAGLFFGIGAAAGAQIAFTIFDTLTDKRLTWGILGIIGFATLIGYALLHRMTIKHRPNAENTT